MSDLVKTGKEITKELKTLYEGFEQVLNKVDEFENNKYLILPSGPAKAGGIPHGNEV